ncbi:MAG: hypothetical protein A4E48_00118 [Methanosaeta sp. PtaU1.Bin060]|nr:MAG: hypothetical protein A4E48_00118 [Methanosaeta sp. PtaU1.Bin060]
MASPQWGNLPAACRILPNWVLWKAVEREGRVTKVPLDRYGKNASSTASHTWCHLDEARAAFESGKGDGVGFVFSRASGISGIDLDHCRDASTGEIDAWAVKILDRLNSYSEISPSGQGVHILVRGLLPEGVDGRKKALLGDGYRPNAAIEIYSAGRYFTMTGNILPGHPQGVEDRQAELTAFFEELFGRSQGEAGKKPTDQAVDGASLSDEAVIDLMLKSAHAEEIGRLLRGDTSAYGGDDSAADMALCNHLAFWTGKDPQKMDRIFRKSGLMRPKWDEKRGAQTYGERTITEAINGTAECYEPGSDILAKIKANPRALKDPAVLEGLARLRAEDPIEYDLVLEAVRKDRKGLRVATINELVDRHSKKTTMTEQPNDDIKAKALAIAEQGDPLRYLIWQAQMNHLGDIDYQEVLIASIASAASQTSNGIQPGGTGEKGSGKSDACAAVYHLIPPDRRLDGSLSPMSLFYLQETGRLKPGMILFSDDVEYEPIVPIYKRSTARFQHGITHFSVSGGKDRHGIELKIPPRIVWWLTSVEGVANEQAFDRQYPISTDSSPEHKKRVAKEIAARRARKELRLSADEGVEIARGIIADIFANGPFRVLIPQAEKAEWLKVSDFRGQEQFWDLVDALVILRWRQHERDPDGWLIAKDEDLVEAKGILSHHKVAHYADLTDAEVKVVGALSSGLPMTQKELTEALGIAQSTLSERLRSIIAKSAIVTEDVIGGRKVYALNPQMQLGKDYWVNLDLIDIKTDISETYRRRQIALSDCYRYVIGIPIGIIINNSSRVPTSLSVNKEKSIEKGYPCNDCGRCPLREYHSSLSQPKTTDNATNQQQETLSGTDNQPNNATDKSDNAISESTNEPITQTSAAVDEKAVDETVAVRFNTDYQTDWKDADGKTFMRQFQEGEVAQVSPFRVQAWAKRGVVDILEEAGA